MFRRRRDEPTNLVDLLEDRVRKTPHADAYKFSSELGWGTMTWQQVDERTSAVAAGLIARGVSFGDRVAIMSSSRIEWVLAAFGILKAGAAVVAIYPETGRDGVAHILTDSGSRLVFVESRARSEVVEATGLPDAGLEIVTFDESSDEYWRFSELGFEPNSVSELERRAARIMSSDLATLIYTSGSTGLAKGVMLTHGNWLAEAQAIEQLNIVDESDVEYFWLPLAHSFGMALLFGQLAVGFLKFIDGDPKHIVKNLQDIRPTFMAGPPRTFEKIAAGVQAKIDASGVMTRQLYKAALIEGRARLAVRRQLGLTYKPPRTGLEALVFRKLTKSFGGRLRLLISGGAALSPDIGELFDLWGVPILVGYGLTETCGASVVMRPDRHAVGSVGSPLPGTFVKTDVPRDGQTDGEILLRGPHVMAGYYGDEDATAQAFTPDGWLRTGDLGRVVDGTVWVTGRLKFSGKLSSGKYVSPERVETLLTATGYVAHATVVVDGRKFVTAVVSLDPDAISAWAGQQAVAGNYAAIVADPRTHAFISQLIADRVNSQLEGWERVGKFVIADEEFTPTNMFLTPSNKVARHIVLSTYAARINALYEVDA